MTDAWVYMVRCRDGSLYVGSARGELDHRIAEHNAGVYGGYTALRRPVELVWAERFATITDAIAEERRLKKWSRAKKEALIAGNVAALKAAARRRTAFGAPFATRPSAAPRGEEEVE